MDILAIIPARGGSKGIPLKNIRPLAGKPLLYYTIDAALKSKYVTRTIVSTEDERIKNTVSKYDVEIIDRPLELAQDETKTAPVLLHVLDELEKQGYVPDITVLLQATCPTRDAKELDEAFDLYFKNVDKGCDSVFAAKKVGLTHSHWRKIPEYYRKDGESEFECLFDYRNRPRRQDEDKHYEMYRETGATYIIKTEVLKEVKDFIGNYPQAYIDGILLDIDTIEDFDKAEKIIEMRKQKCVSL